MLGMLKEELGLLERLGEDRSSRKTCSMTKEAYVHEGLDVLRPASYHD